MYRFRSQKKKKKNIEVAVSTGRRSIDIDGPGHGGHQGLGFADGSLEGHEVPSDGCGGSPATNGMLL